MSYIYLYIYIHIFGACVAQRIGRVTPNVVSAGSILMVETKNLQLGSTLMVSILPHVSHCLIDLIYIYIYMRLCGAVDWSCDSDCGERILVPHSHIIIYLYIYTSRIA